MSHRTSVLHCTLVCLQSLVLTSMSNCMLTHLEPRTTSLYLRFLTPTIFTITVSFQFTLRDPTPMETGTTVLTLPLLAYFGLQYSLGYLF